MIKYRIINVDAKNDLVKLMNIVLDNLERKEFFHPFTNAEIEDMFDATKTIIYGAYDEDKLVGCACLFLQELDVLEIKNIINLNDDLVIKMGCFLVLEEYRNKGIIKELESRLISIAKHNRYKYIVITTHPDNIPSNKVILSINAKLVKTAMLENYLRNIYLLKLS